MMKKISFLAISLCLLFSISGCKTEINFAIPGHPLLFSDEPEYSKTDYPIVLVHGLYGFDDIFGLQYFYQIPTVLRNGGAEVYIAEVSGTTKPEQRGEQLIKQLDEFAAISGKPKFNLFGHSLGAPTIRYVAATRPDLVASVTSVAGANFGSDVADAKALDIPPVALIIGLMGNVLGHVIDIVSQNNFEQNILDTLESMSSEGIVEFNGKYPDGLPSAPCGTDGDEVVINAISNEPIRYYSWGGNAQTTNKLDPLDLLHAVVTKAIDGDDDDGIVPRCSMQLGHVIRDDYKMNHLDHMNWFLGLKAKDAPYPPALYRAQANRLKTLGL
ncbi:Triacylglycerol lipase [BD1-7 clade bacterium]|uniref:Triacylglycerol lipase n=1 Tax=BD1-7 clade bacterium TaxID=2029982 RepID=A0A5S9QNX4_9GAMM|nr:Triacylglycerol lipase [BD1-7 clade bacterium]CAA0116519.1 Triacylglycerol lipase [BD1-7 clade bacterium]CAA0120136.1 Triacylglycerol lipase [BD1-7 clade bacterium]